MLPGILLPRGRQGQCIHSYKLSVYCWSLLSKWKCCTNSLSSRYNQCIFFFNIWLVCHGNFFGFSSFTWLPNIYPSKYQAFSNKMLLFNFFHHQSFVAFFVRVVSCRVVLCCVVLCCVVLCCVVLCWFSILYLSCLRRPLCLYFHFPPPTHCFFIYLVCILYQFLHLLYILWWISLESASPLRTNNGLKSALDWNKYIKYILLRENAAWYSSCFFTKFRSSRRKWNRNLLNSDKTF